MSKKIDEYIKQKSKILNKRLKELITKKEKPFSKLFKIANYALFPGGKRLRPILTLATVETLKKDFTKALDVACAIEMIHTYSLIHDDLPCMDNDEFRRKKPSLHIAFSEWEALLAGDFLLTYAFEIISQSSISNQKKVEIIKVLSKRAGGEGMIMGQYLDIEYENKKIYPPKFC